MGRVLPATFRQWPSRPNEESRLESNRKVRGRTSGLLTNGVLRILRLLAPRGFLHEIGRPNSFDREDIETLDDEVRLPVIEFSGQEIFVKFDTHHRARGHFAGDLVVPSQTLVRAGDDDRRAGSFGIPPGRFE